MTTTVTTATERPSPRRRASFWAWVFAVICVGFVAFWVWALFFASKESVNKIGDRAWATRAEGICATAVDQMEGLRDFRRIDHGGPDEAAQLAERAGIVDHATDIVEQMLDDVVAAPPIRRQGPGDRAAMGGRLPHVHREPP